MYLKAVQDCQGDDKPWHRSDHEVVAGAGPLIHGHKEPGGQITEHVEGLETWVVADSGIVDDLGEHNQVLKDDHPGIEREEVGESEVGEETDI